MSSNLQPGTSLGPYEILSPIAKGGMGIVYRARHKGLNREVALKVLYPHLTDDAEFVSRFEREGQAMAQLRHPNIAEVFDAGAIDDMHYIAMDFLPGGTLATELSGLRKNGQFMPIERAMSMTRQIALALDYAHGKGFVHRDIKPSNILIASDGRYVLSDFGIVHDASKTKLTRTMSSLGTPEYMSPEQAQGMPVDRRSDLYSLGVVLYEALAGVPPFTGETPLSVLNKQLKDPPPSLSKIRVGVPPEAVAVVSRALAKKPEQRYQTAAQMAADIDGVLVAVAKPARSGVPGWIIAVAALLLLVGAGAVIIALIANSGTPAAQAPATLAPAAQASATLAPAALAPVATAAPTAAPIPTGARPGATEPSAEPLRPTSTLAAPGASAPTADQTAAPQQITVVVTSTPAPTATRGPTRTPSATSTPTPTAEPTSAVTGLSATIDQNRGGYEKWGAPAANNACVGDDKRGTAQKFSIVAQLRNASGSDVPGVRASFIASNGVVLPACGNIPTLPNNQSPRVPLYAISFVPISAVQFRTAAGVVFDQFCFSGINASRCSGPVATGGAVAPTAVAPTAVAPGAGVSPTPIPKGNVDITIFNNSGTTNLEAFLYENGNYRLIWRLNNGETKTFTQPSGRVSFKVCRTNSSGQCFFIDREFRPGQARLQVNGYDSKNNCAYDYRDDGLRACIGVFQ